MPGYRSVGKCNPSEILPGVFSERRENWMATVCEINSLLNKEFI